MIFPGKFFREWILPIGLALLVVFVIRTYVVEPRYIPSPSMVPTLQVNDVVLINKMDREPQRGDIMIFDPPAKVSQNDVFIKRVIGMPGDKISIRNGVLYCNGEELKEIYLPEPIVEDFGPVTVPEGQYFMMGDNRNHSYDSRYWGPLPKERILGKAMVRIFPFDRLTKF